MADKTRSFLKWAGGKYRLSEAISETLPEGKRLIEPFVGAASVFLNTDYDRYLLNDINEDLINLYRYLQSDVDGYLHEARKLFNPSMNQKERYLDIRVQFNACSDPLERSVFFLYLNRHCYNGLCRYNRSGGFNVPFGSYVRPYFPEKELRLFAEKAQRAEFVCMDYQDVFKQAKKGDVIYCDPPYVPLSKTASFTTYAKNGFSMDEQQRLAVLAHQYATKKNVPVLLSNHATEWIEGAYGKATERKYVKVNRAISTKGHTRKSVDEVLALYLPDDFPFSSSQKTQVAV